MKNVGTLAWMILAVIGACVIGFVLEVGDHPLDVKGSVSAEDEIYFVAPYDNDDDKWFPYPKEIREVTNPGSTLVPTPSNIISDEIYGSDW